MTRRRAREAAPLQVYLVADERDRLDRLADQLDATKSDVIRRGLLALERELQSPTSHPALRLIGIADAETAGMAPVDAAREHDHEIADGEETSWTPQAPSRKRRRPVNNNLPRLQIHLRQVRLVGGHPVLLARGTANHHDVAARRLHEVAMPGTLQ